VHARPADQLRSAALVLVDEPALDALIERIGQIPIRRREVGEGDRVEGDGEESRLLECELDVRLADGT